MRQLSLEVEQPALTLSSRRPVREPAGGSLTEVIVGEDSAIQPLQLLPLLAHCTANERWLMWLSPNRTLNKQWLAGMGMENAAVVHIDLCTDTQTSLCQRILQTGNAHLIIEWQGSMDSSSREQLKQLARSSGSHVVLIQHGQA